MVWPTTEIRQGSRLSNLYTSLLKQEKEQAKDKAGPSGSSSTQGPTANGSSVQPKEKKLTDVVPASLPKKPPPVDDRRYERLDSYHKMSPALRNDSYKNSFSLYSRRRSHSPPPRKFAIQSHRDQRENRDRSNDYYRPGPGR